jgi:hypothetical protein
MEQIVVHTLPVATRAYVIGRRQPPGTGRARA